MTEKDCVQNWDLAYRLGMTMWHPSECVIRFMARNFKKQTGLNEFEVIREAKRALDLGCGNGANVLFLKKMGYDAYGIDISKTAVELGNSLMLKNGFARNLICCDMEDLDFKNDYFDIIISHAALDHIRVSKFKRVLEKIKEKLADQGYIFITLRGREAFEYEKRSATEVEPYTLITGESKQLSSPFENPHEKNIPQHFFDIGEIRDLLKGFDVINIEKAIEYGGEDLGYVDSRWFIAAGLTK